MAWKVNKLKRRFARQRVAKRFGWHQGSARFKKCPKIVKYKSSYELIVAQYLDNNEKVIKFLYEPISITYSLMVRGKAELHKYYPDFLIYFKDGSKEMWEVKPSSQVKWYKNVYKWKYAMAYCKKIGIKFKIITEKDIKLMR